ncbi:hypothetical protein [Candidatus Phytoplasma ziziphi]|uniref:hypothetical protein n=1 Tax=Candidatus Phytoplasma TaxID=33926 RepID=UPI00137513B9|nr:hypothetical protein [Candidatus Phytoplasma ziziphi]
MEFAKTKEFFMHILVTQVKMFEVKINGNTKQKEVPSVNMNFIPSFEGVGQLAFA